MSTASKKSRFGLKFTTTEKSMLISLVLHTFFAGVLTGTLLPKEPPPPPSVEFKVIENPIIPPPPKPLIIPTNTSKLAKPNTKATSGVSRDSTVENAAADAPKIKLGNTLSKAPDNNPSNDAPLPPPAEEFEVSVWPALKNDVRVPYPREAKTKNIEGSVVMDLYVSEAGQVLRATLVQGPGFGLNEAALEAAKQFLFSPAKVGDKVMPIVIRYSYKFVIQR